MLPRQDSNLDYLDPESSVLPITPRGNYINLYQRTMNIGSLGILPEIQEVVTNDV